jgi:hypothetical protein
LGALAGGLGCSPLDDESSHPPSHAPRSRRGIRRLVRVGKREAPSPIQRATSAAPLRAGAAPKCISGRTSYLRVRLAFHPYPQLIRALCNAPRCGPPRACSARFGLATGSSPGFGSAGTDSGAGSPAPTPFRTRLRSGSACPRLSLAGPSHSSAHSTKGTPSPGTKPGSDRPEAHGFRLCFTPLSGVLFTVPSRYWCTLGRARYLALGGGPPRFPPDSACRAVLTQHPHPAPDAVAYGALTPCGGPFQRPSAGAGRASEDPAGSSGVPVLPPRGIAGGLCRRAGFGSPPFARRY